MEFQIFQKVPAPPQKRGPGFGVRESKYPFDQLQIDDVLIIPGTTSKNFGPTVRAAEQRLPGYFFTVRTGPVMVKVAGDDGVEVDTEVVPAGAVGVWRVPAKAERKPQKARSAEQKAAAAEKAKVTRAANLAAKKAAAEAAGQAPAAEATGTTG